ncbi:MAG: hypothetical protein ACYTF2_12555, partial [Planctomycetota bacterium]
FLSGPEDGGSITEIDCRGGAGNTDGPHIERDRSLACGIVVPLLAREVERSHEGTGLCPASVCFP